jgi:uncharacterized protein
MDKQSNKRIEQIARFVEKRLKDKARDEADAHNRWQHTLRVTNYGKVLAEAEGANVEVVVAACLLHELAVFDDIPEQEIGRKAAELARPFLQKQDFDARTQDAICYAVACHVDVPNPDTLEAKVVTDADNIDRFGAYRAIQYVAQDANKYTDLITSLLDRIHILRKVRGRDVMETTTGNQMFNEQVEQQLEMYDALLKENDWTVLPKI